MYVYRVKIAGHNADGSDRYFGVYRADSFGLGYLRQAIENAMMLSRKVDETSQYAKEWVNGAMEIAIADLPFTCPTFYGNVVIESFKDDDDDDDDIGVWGIPGYFDCHHCGRPGGH